jgi:hypothetical protein
MAEEYFSVGKIRFGIPDNKILVAYALIILGTALFIYFTFGSNAAQEGRWCQINCGCGIAKAT